MFVGFFGFLLQDGVGALAFNCVKMILVAVAGISAGYAMGLTEGYHQGMEVAKARNEVDALLANEPSKISREGLEAMSKTPMPFDHE